MKTYRGAVTAVALFLWLAAMDSSWARAGGGGGGSGKGGILNLIALPFFIIYADQFWAHLEGSMIDYTIDDTNHRVVSGNNKKAESFTELWKFVRSGDSWVLDEIDQKVSLSDLKNFEAKSNN